MPIPNGRRSALKISNQQSEEGGGALHRRPLFLFSPAERAFLDGLEGKEFNVLPPGIDYERWSKALGFYDAAKTVAEFNALRYTDSERFALLQGYISGVEKEDISPLVGFSEYERQATEIKHRMVGKMTPGGISIESFATHFIDRVIGQTSTPHDNMRCGVSIDDALDALRHPIKPSKTRICKDGDIRQTVYGAHAKITYSIRDKRLIQVNPARGR